MRRTLFGLACLLVAGTARAADPVCALIDPDRLPATALLESKLLAGGGRWVERNHVERALKEQQLQALFGPQDGARRAALGRVLKADVLVMVRRMPGAAEPSAEVVVCETVHGLRLVVRAGPTADVDGLAAIARQGIRKFGEQVMQVVAVPPFVSHDLEFRHDHLKGAYAKLIEAAALARPGVVAVELAEADAIAAELRLAAPGAVVRRPTPLYLHGEYRHVTPGAASAVALTLRATRAGKPVGESSERVVKPEEAPAVLRAWALDRIGSGQVATGDPLVEAKELAELATARKRIGDWPEAITLTEASLLLNPNQPRLRADAMVCLMAHIAKVLEAHYQNGKITTKSTPGPRGLPLIETVPGTGHGPRIGDLDAARRIAQLHRRGWEHMDALIRSRIPPEQAGVSRPFGRWFHSAAFGENPHVVVLWGPTGEPTKPYGERDQKRWTRDGLRPAEGASPELVENYASLIRDRRAAAAPLLPLVIADADRLLLAVAFRAAFGTIPAVELTRLRNSAKWEVALFVHMTLGGLPAKERFAELGRLLLRHQDSPAVTLATRALLTLNSGTLETELFREDIRELRPLLDRLEREGNPELRAVAKQVRLGLPQIEREADRIAVARAKGDIAAAKRDAEQRKRAWDGTLTPPYEDDIARLDAKLTDKQFQRIRFTVSPAEAARSAEDLRGCLQVGPSTDVVWGQNRYKGPALFVMKDKGTLKLVWELRKNFLEVKSVRFDGRYVWFVLGWVNKPPSLVVLDAEAERVYEVTDGFPEAPPRPLAAQDQTRHDMPLLLTPLEPGRVCLAGYFGRTWIGTATFDPIKKAATVRVFHTAREVQTPADESQWERATVAFAPTRIAVETDASGVRRVRIGRGGGWPEGDNGSGANRLVAAHSLLVDPDRGTVEVDRTEPPAKPKAPAAKPQAPATKTRESSPTAVQAQAAGVSAHYGRVYLVRLNETVLGRTALCSLTGPEPAPAPRPATQDK